MEPDEIAYSTGHGRSQNRQASIVKPNLMRFLEHCYKEQSALLGWRTSLQDREARRLTDLFATVLGLKKIGLPWDQIVGVVSSAVDAAMVCGEV